jgi:hypothetical protein
VQREAKLPGEASNTLILQESDGPSRDTDPYEMVYDSFAKSTFELYSFKSASTNLPNPARKTPRQARPLFACQAMEWRSGYCIAACFLTQRTAASCVPNQTPCFERM